MCNVTSIFGKVLILCPFLRNERKRMVGEIEKNTVFLISPTDFLPEKQPKLCKNVTATCHGDEMFNVIDSCY
jgi:hypothetical protein